MAKTLVRKGQVQRGLRPNLKKAPVEVEAPSESILDKVEAELEKEGIMMFDDSNIMEEFLRLPADITEVESRDLGRYFNAFTKQKMYCRTLLGRTSALLRELTEELDDIRDKVYSNLPVKMSIKEKELKLRSHEKYGERAIELLGSLAVMQEKQNMLKIYLENLVDGIFNISREISRREADWGDHQRENSIDNKRRRR